MKKQIHATDNDLGTLAEDARALMAATADVAGEKVEEARKRLAAALEDGKQMFDRVREKAVDGAKIADQTVREYPYQGIAIALGVGAVIGCLAAHRCSRND
jgi:ElaB/YqjD/DUF883 family membrane-anchored ribosome-binding protein